MLPGCRSPGGAAPALRAQTGADVQELVSSAQLGASTGGVGAALENGGSSGSIDFVEEQWSAVRGQQATDSRLIAGG